MMNECIDEYVIQGVVDNLGFCKSMINNADFRKGNYDTSFIGKNYPNGYHGEELKPQDYSYLAVVAARIKNRLQRQKTEIGRTPSYWNDVYVVIDKDHQYKIGINRETHEYVIHDLINKGTPQTIKIDDWDIQKNTLIHTTLTTNGKKEKTVLQFIGANKEIEYDFWFRQGERKLKVYSEQQFNLLKHMAPPKVIDYSKRIMSQMPGKVISVNVKNGQEVQDGQEICVIEAMKM